MNRLIRAELRKLFTTTWWKVTIITTLAMGPVSAVSAALSWKRTTGLPGSPAEIHHVLSTAALTSMVMLAMGIAAAAGEYRHSTSIPTFLITPRRRDVIIAKLLTIGLVGGALGAVTFGLSVAAAVPALSSKGVHHLAGDTAQMWIGCTVVSAAYGALGTAIGALARSTVVAMIAAFTWAFFIEASFLDTVFPSLGKWLPTGANIAITHTTAHPGDLLNPSIAAAVLAVWTAAITVTALRVATRRDV
jgi:ABC-type transport system involved in multi-copper enzyme maturation permease subunit